MIYLNYPKETQRYYLTWSNQLLGPMDLSGKTEPDRFEVRALKDFIVEEPCAFKENAVENYQLTGDITYHPMLTTSTNAATKQYPRQIKVPLIYSAGNVVSTTVPYGLAVSGSSSIVRQPEGTFNFYVHRAWLHDAKYNTWHTWEITADKTQPFIARNCSHIVLTGLCPKGKDILSVTELVFGYTLSGAKGFIDWSKPQSFDTISTWIPPNPVPLTIPPRLTAYNYYKTSGLMESPGSLLRGLEVRADSWFPKDFPLSGVHFGDLAMEASLKTVPNHVNMMAFLRDLRHPTELIPKLKNLRKLKTWSHNYLTVKYGIFPTISDLQEIAEALKKMKPYIDKNGFSTYSAGHIESVVIDNVYYESQQHIKLAIDDEDNIFDTLVEGIEGTGFLPTCENIWDLIPYSFVIDWFADIGDICARADTKARLMRLNIRYVTTSRKMISTKRVDSESYPLVGQISQVHYHRWVSDQCPVPPLFPPIKPDAQSHWLEATALIIQHRK